MKGARTPAGYTIVEVMIVLAVSGLMFLMAANFIGNKQEATSFPQGVNELASSIQNTIAQVSNGQYSDINIVCNFHYISTDPKTSFIPPITLAAGPGTTTNSSANDSQGTNTQCTFLGKVMHFSLRYLTGNGITSQQYETFSVAGGRLDNNNQPITPDPSNPTTPLDDDGPTPISPLTTQSDTPEHLSVIDMGQEPIAQEPTSTYATFAHGFNPSLSYAVAFLQNLGTTSQVGALNGSQPINLYYVNGIDAGMTSGQAAATITGANLTLVPNGQEIVMCVTDYKQYAYIEIGGGSQLGVRVRMLGTNQCT